VSVKGDEVEEKKKKCSSQEVESGSTFESLMRNGGKQST
jgi:hypothetical protein